MVVVGAGWIGSEFAASARQRGLEVTVVDPLALPNERIFGPEIGAFYRDVHAEHGVELVLGDGVEAFAGDGVVRQVRTGGGRAIDCDFVVVGIGVTPRTELARSAGLDVDNGVLVDETLRTSAANVFAAGDVAGAWHPFYGERIRVEHWSNALNQGPAAARAMLGEPDAATTGSPTSSPISTTSAWSTPVTHRRGTRSSSAASATGRVRRVLAQGSARPGRHERQRLGRQRARPGADPRTRSRSTPPR